jgi:hypothetical protein
MLGKYGIPFRSAIELSSGKEKSVPERYWERAV